MWEQGIKGRATAGKCKGSLGSLSGQSGGLRCLGPIWHLFKASSCPDYGADHRVAMVYACSWPRECGCGNYSLIAIQAAGRNTWVRVVLESLIRGLFHKCGLLRTLQCILHIQFAPCARTACNARLADRPVRMSRQTEAAEGLNSSLACTAALLARWWDPVSANEQATKHG